MLLLGIDIGTTGAKATVFDIDGNIKGVGFQEYGIICNDIGRAEQDAESVWEITKTVIKQAVKDVSGEIKALSVSVQGDAIIPIDKNRNALALTQLGMDYRGISESKFCEEIFGGNNLFRLTGMRPHPLNSLIKILWIKNNQPELYYKTYKFVTYSDFILGKLGSDDIVIDYSMASRTMAFDIKALKWSDEILYRLDIDKEKLAKPVQSGKAVGRISKKLANDLGLNEGVIIVSGGHDQTCAALGSGVIKENIALDSHGTAEVVSTAFNNLRVDSIMYDSFYPCYLHVVPGMYFTFSLNHVGGILLKWFVEGFCHEEVEEAQRTGQSVYDAVIGKIKSDSPSPVFVLPHFNGSGTPTCDLNSKGAILGLTLTTTRHDIAKAVIEALSYELRINIERLKRTGIEINDIRCVGGGARSPIGLQSKADILGIPVSTLKIREAACLGAGMMAGVASGAYNNVNEAASNIIRISDTYYPRANMQDIFNERYCIYSQIYESIKDLMHKI